MLKKLFFLPIMAVFGGCGGTAATAAVFFKVSKNLCQENTFLFSYLYSEIKTKPNNHGLHESGKTSPPPWFKVFQIYFFLEWVGSWGDSQDDSQVILKKAIGHVLNLRKFSVWKIMK